MARSRLSPDTGSGDDGGVALAIGDARTVCVKDKDGLITKTITIIRTQRSYAHDLCDAYNAARSQVSYDRGAEWYVDHMGQLKLGEAYDWARMRTDQIAAEHARERQLWKQRNGGLL